jgi:hypothetical protein
MTAFVDRLVAGQKADVGIESDQKPRDPGDPHAFGQAAFEARDRRLGQAAATGEDTLAQPALHAQAAQHPAEHAEGMPGLLVETPDRMRHTRI